MKEKLYNDRESQAIVEIDHCKNKALMGTAPQMVEGAKQCWTFLSEPSNDRKSQAMAEVAMVVKVKQ